MGRKRINGEVMSARFAPGTFKRMDSVRGKREKRMDLIREAIEREIKRRQRAERAQQEATA